MLFFLALSILGCVLCVALHVLTYAGFVGGWSRALATGLFVGSVLVFVAAIAVSKSGPRGAEDKFELDELWKCAPRWARRLAVVVIVYAAGHFAFFAIAQDGEPTVEPTGALTLRSKGKLVRTITPAEFRWHQGLHARAMSGHPLIFYTLGAMMFLGARRQWRELDLASSTPDQAAAPAAAAAAAAATTTLQYGRASPPLPIWVHLLLFVLSFMVAWLGMLWLLMIGIMRLPLVPPPVKALLVIVGWLGGLVVVNLVFRKAIPARCPSCLGRAYCVEMNKPTRYLCRDCGYEYRSGT